eukprot:scaffold5584_cov76-Cyclotella_meneghiniana.AAC.1
MQPASWDYCVSPVGTPRGSSSSCICNVGGWRWESTGGRRQEGGVGQSQGAVVGRQSSAPSDG